MSEKCFLETNRFTWQGKGPGFQGLGAGYADVNVPAHETQHAPLICLQIGV